MTHRTRTALQPGRAAVRAVGGAAIGLMVVGAGAAVGMAGHHGSPSSLRVAAASRATGSTATAGPAMAPVSTVDPAGVTASTVGATPVAVAGGGTGASGAGVAGSVSGSGSAGSAGSGATPGGTGPGDAGTAGGAVVGASPAGQSSGAAEPSSATQPSGSGQPSGTDQSPAPAAGSGAGPTAPAVPPLPAPGSYSYATSGGSQITLLGSSTYPAATTVAVAGRRCGDSFTWQSSPGNTQTTVECPVPGGVRVVTESMTITSHGYSDTQTFQCGADAFVPVGSGAVGQTWKWTCTSSGGEAASQVVRFAGRQTVMVGGVPVSADEVSVDSTLAGAEKGSITSTYWLASNALPVRQTGTAAVTADGFTYRSQYTLQLTSLRPS